MKILIYKLFSCSILLMIVWVGAENFRKEPKADSFLLQERRIVKYITNQTQELIINDYHRLQNVKKP